MIVRDGEGTSRVVGVRLRGARNDREAETAARAIANSSLVRTSWCGGDPNWGRILCALGYSKARIDRKRDRRGLCRARQPQNSFCISAWASDKCRVESVGPGSLQRPSSICMSIFTAVAANS